MLGSFFVDKCRKTRLLYLNIFYLILKLLLSLVKLKNNFLQDINFNVITIRERYVIYRS